MVLAAEQYDELAELLTAMSDRGLSAPQAERLAELMRDNPSAQQLYLDFIELHTMLAWQYQERNERREGTNSEGGTPKDGWQTVPCGSDPSPCAVQRSRLSSLPPIIIQTLPSPQSALLPFIGGALFSYLLAAVIVGVGLLVAAAWQRSDLRQIVDRESPSAPRLDFTPTRPAAVARITAMVDCTWSDPETEALVGAYVPLGRKYALASGLMEITYDTGAKVILQGPMNYEVESPAGGYLAVGKLTAKLEKRSAVSGQRSETPNPQSLIPNPLFAIRTPTALVTDLGTEFGVEVDQSGATKSHVFRGRIEVRVTGEHGAEKAIQLGENESAQVNVGQGQVLTVTRAKVNGAAFTRTMPKRVPIRVFNTGQAWIEGSPDPHWQVVAISNVTPGIRPYPALVTTVWDGHWMENEFHQSQWISSASSGLVVDGVTYTFRTTFDLAGLRTQTARLKGAFVVDNHVEAIRLNGHSVPVPEHGYDLYQCWHPFAIQDGFADGVNVLEFDVRNGLPEILPKKGSRMGLRVRLEGVAERKEEGR